MKPLIFEKKCADTYRLIKLMYSDKNLNLKYEIFLKFTTEIRSR